MTRRKSDLAHEVEAREDLHEASSNAAALRKRLEQRKSDPTATPEYSNAMESMAEADEERARRAQIRLERALLRRRNPRPSSV